MNRQRRTLNVVLFALLGATLAVACSPSETGIMQGQTGDPVIVLSEGACKGTCPVYDLTLHPDGAYILNGDRFVKTVGVTDGNIGADPWVAAEGVLKSADFWTAKQVQTSDTLANCHTDAPTVRVTWRTSEGKEKTIIYDAGCGVRKTQEMISALRTAMRFDDLVWTDAKFDPSTGEPG